MEVIKRGSDGILQIINPDKPTIVVLPEIPYIGSSFYQICQEGSDFVIKELKINVGHISISYTYRNHKDFQKACSQAMYSVNCELLQFGNTEEYNDWLASIQKAEKERLAREEQKRLEKLYQQYGVSTTSRYMRIPSATTSTFYHTM